MQSTNCHVRVSLPMLGAMLAGCPRNGERIPATVSSAVDLVTQPADGAAKPTTSRQHSDPMEQHRRYRQRAGRVA